MGKYNRFVDLLSGALNIPAPEVVFTSLENSFNSKTEMANTEITENNIRIFIRDGLKNQNDIFFALAHELRHCWQFNQQEYKVLFEKYEKNNTDDNLNYNLQDLEIDANAYAGCVMRKVFGVKPLFSGMSEKQRIIILNRIEEMQNDIELQLLD